MRPLVGSSAPAARDAAAGARDLANDTLSDLSRQSYRSFAVGDGEQHLQDAARPLPARPATPPPGMFS
jgi:flavin-binding protein dodecin